MPQLILSFIPKNPFADLTGANPTSIIPVVIFAAFLGVAAIRLVRRNAEKRRTALNVSGSMTAGTVTSQLLGQTDRSILTAEDDGDLQGA